MDCVYKTPCGWCSKWDKECDEKMHTKSFRMKHPKGITETNNPCLTCGHYGWDMPQCKECNKYNGFKYFSSK